ncbi:MAG: T9SS type A sorting domain-containing protein, partial [Ignavibacteriaceae bacterium]|nr:T9SS type A sorting domain-containing protein [Ignavibacteriaceae bacterium]
DNLIPGTFALGQNYPNPFNPSTTINFALPQTSNVVLKVYDVLGREVATLLNGEKAAGNYEVNFDASQFASGMYIYTLQAGNFSTSKKMMLMK